MTIRNFALGGQTDDAQQKERGVNDTLEQEIGGRISWTVGLQQ